MAIEKGSFHEGVPAITVIVYGGWSKRSRKHSYNAKSDQVIQVSYRLHVPRQKREILIKFKQAALHSNNT